MHEVFLDESPVKIHLPGDEDNPTWYTTQPSTPLEAARYAAMVKFARLQAAKASGPASESLEGITDAETREITQSLEFLAARTFKIENAHPKGRTIEDPKEIRRYIFALANKQMQDFIGVIQDGNAMAALKFRGDDASSATGAAPPGDEAAERAGEDRGADGDAAVEGSGGDESSSFTPPAATAIA